MKPRALAISAALAASALCGHGAAFCRATTCDPSHEACERDSGSCLTSGEPLSWTSRCVRIYVQADGSPKLGIGFDLLQEHVARAFDTWLSADCGGSPPLLDVQVLGPITCATSEYNSTKQNANIVMFRDRDWPYVGGEDTLGLTVLRFDADTGELWDADLEINSATYRFSVGEPVTDNDLDSMLTHEAGHLLGLAHTLVADATMFARYQAGTDTLRTLANDDEQAICATYPKDRVPSRSSCAPRHGFSDRCAVEQPEKSATSAGTDEDTTNGGTHGRADDAPAENDTNSKGCAFGARSARGRRGTGLAVVGCVLAIAMRRRRRRRARRPRLASTGELLLIFF